MFNLSNDIKEQCDISKEKPLKTKALEKILDNYLSSVRAPKWKEGITWKEIPVNQINSTH